LPAPQCLTFLWDKIFRIAGKNLISPGRETFITAPLLIFYQLATTTCPKLRFPSPQLVGVTVGFCVPPFGGSGGLRWVASGAVTAAL